MRWLEQQKQTCNKPYPPLHVRLTEGELIFFGMKDTFAHYRYKITLTELVGVQQIDGLAGFHLILLVSYLCG